MILRLIKFSALAQEAEMVIRGTGKPSLDPARSS
eukprot:CAMPEP_0203650106 /NCGR_PEP_ID=MMETSP0088-20131115/23700_1 /ASSEMBLY_ACC=CAM_ASM_001087 /TAXON_ID=426623 /ORGANISM="Chaetoceros affinis, Strain CCMP159" /LENGTH=33 /DNA_ID= /DNA_START= /DNA_END= /DNA_ORIENTATION=